MKSRAHRSGARLGAAVGVAIVCAIGQAHAQPAQPAQPTQPNQVTQPAPPPPSTPTTPPDVWTPPPVNDPLLAPPQPAPRVVADLKDALDLVRSRSADLRTAFMEIERAEGQSRSALATLLPQANANASYTQQILTRPNFPDNSQSLGVSLSWLIFSLPAYRARRTALMNEDVLRLAFEDEKRVVLSSVITNVVAVVTTERVADLNRVGLRASLERLELVKLKEKLGSGTTLDIRRAEQDVESSRSSVVTGDEALRQAREALALSVGLTGQMGAGPAMTLPALESDVDKTCGPLERIEDRADIQSAARNLEIRYRAIDDVWAQFLPTVSLSSALSTSSSSLTAAPPTNWGVTGTINVPIWDGGNRYGLLRVARALAEESRVQLEAQKRALVTATEQARRAIDVATASRSVAERAQKLAEEVDRLVQAQYRMGQGTSLDLVTAATAKRQADINLALADFALAKALLVSKLTLSACKY